MLPAGQRVEDRVLRPAVGEQMPCHGVGVGAWIAVAIEILAVIPPRGLVPLLLDIRDGAQLVRGREKLPDLRVVAEMRLNIRVDDHAPTSQAWPAHSVLMMRSQASLMR
jgi:hypothetical protein